MKINRQKLIRNIYIHKHENEYTLKHILTIDGGLGFVFNELEFIYPLIQFQVDKAIPVSLENRTRAIT